METLTRSREYTEHNWRPYAKVVTRALSTGQKYSYVSPRGMGSCTRCGLLRDREDRAGAPWLDPQGQPISPTCLGLSKRS